MGTDKSKFNNKVIFIELKKSVILKFSDEFDLRDAIFKSLRTIKGIEVFIIFTEIKKNKTRINLRSSHKVNVAKLAKNFQGGGHKKASGCMIEKNIKDARTTVMKEIKKIL